MIASILTLLMAWSPQGQVAEPSLPYVVSIVNEMVGDDMVIRLVLTSPPGSYSATRDGNDIFVRVAATPLVGLSLPSPNPPIAAFSLGTEPGFTLRVTLTENRTHEILRDLSSLRLVLKPAATTTDQLSPGVPAEPTLGLTPPSGREGTRTTDPMAVDTADLYSRLFPSSGDAAAVDASRSEIGAQENWYSNFSWLGLQLRPWVSVTYVDNKTTEIEARRTSKDNYWIIQPNLGLGLSPSLGREGQWKVNYTPRFRRRAKVSLPRLTSHFFDAGIDQPAASFGAVYGSYHWSKGVLETEEIDPGREYGIGKNRVLDSSLQQFRRSSLGLGVRLDFITETEIDVSVGKTAVRYGRAPGEAVGVAGERAFFDYDARTLNASARRGLGESRFLSLLFGIHDTPRQKERRQIEGRGYSYAAAVEGDIVALMTGRILVGYRTQKNPNAGEGGRDYKGLAYAAQLMREISEASTIGLAADRRLHLSAYEENGFYVSDAIRGDLNTRIPLSLLLRGTVGLQTNGYRASPQTNDGSSLVLRKDRIRSWSIALARDIAEWASLRAEYSTERRDSNLDRFDIKSRTISFNLRVGFVGKGGGAPRPAW